MLIDIWLPLFLVPVMIIVFLWMVSSKEKRPY